MSEPAVSPMERENAYLKLRLAQLSDDNVALRAEAERLRQIVERPHGRTPSAAPEPPQGRS